MSQSTISYLWREPEAAKGFSTGVSLHSHTNQSKETLDFFANLRDWASLHPSCARAGTPGTPKVGHPPELRRSLLDSATDAAPCIRS